MKLRLISAIAVWLAVAPVLHAQGVLELSTSTTVRARLTAAEISALLPSTRGQFTMPAPWSTTAWRITVPGDCVTAACVGHSAYGYWPQLSNSAGSDTLYIMVVLYGETNGGPTLYTLTKSTGVITKIGPIFNVADPGRSYTGEGMYFSHTYPTRMYYVFNGYPTQERVDVLTHTRTTVFDISTQTGLYGSGKYVWQTHASDDDNVFSFTVRDTTTNNYDGCGTYKVSTNTYTFVPWLGVDYDECQIDHSGEYLLIKEQITTGAVYPAVDPNPADRVIRLSDGREVRRNTLSGGGHSDMGWRQVIMVNDAGLSYSSIDNTDLTASPIVDGTAHYHDPDWSWIYTVHISFTNAVDAPLATQYAVMSTNYSANTKARQNEILAFKLDGSLTVLSIAPNLILNSSNSYTQHAFANVDATGRYVFWTANMGVEGGPLQAFLVYVPSLTGFEGAGASPVRLRFR